MSHIVLLGYVATIALLVCLASGVVLTWQGLFGIRTDWIWRQVHLISTFATLLTLAPHLVLVIVHMRREGEVRPVAPFFVGITVLTAVGIGAILLLPRIYSGSEYVNEFPEDYTYLYGEDRPFAPSLATTTTGGAFDPRSLAGSASCGTAGCHEQILAEWQPSAHRYAAMDTLFQKIQSVMAEQNGPESTRYCGGCHDPISLFAGAKRVFSEELTGQVGFDQGISCLVCHSVREFLRGEDQRFREDRISLKGQLVEIDVIQSCENLFRRADLHCELRLVSRDLATRGPERQERNRDQQQDHDAPVLQGDGEEISQVEVAFARHRRPLG
jgi:hypothetical protein